MYSKIISLFFKNIFRHQFFSSEHFLSSLFLRECLLSWFLVLFFIKEKKLLCRIMYRERRFCFQRFRSYFSNGQSVFCPVMQKNLTNKGRRSRGVILCTMKFSFSITFCVSFLFLFARAYDSFYDKSEKEGSRGRLFKGNGEFFFHLFQVRVPRFLSSRVIRSNAHSS